MDENESNKTGILVGVDFVIKGIEGIKFSGTYGKSNGSQFVAASATDVSLRKLLGDWIPDVELAEITVLYNLNDKSDNFTFSTVLGNSINLSNLPFVGKILPKDQTLAIENLRLVCNAHKALIRADINIGGKVLEPGLELQIGGAEESNYDENKMVSGDPDLLRTAAPNASRLLSNADSQDIAKTGESPASSSADATKWFAIQKSLGTINFKRIGLRFEKQTGTIFFLLDATLAMGPLKVGFAGLGAGSAVKKFSPEFTLDGLSIAYSQGGILISGALLYDRSTEAFAGTAIIKTPVISLAALGGYQSLDGSPSLFIYAVLSSSSGLISVCIGPVFLQLTGICAGFGYNRTLNVPDVYRVKEFPLVSIASGDTDVGNDPLEILQNVKEYIPAAKGELFFAFGVKFNIQKLIDCLALLLVRIGNKINLDIIGTAKLALPTGTKLCLAQVEMAYKVSFNAEEGAVQIAAVLTPASYLFTPRCRLTGGFAFYAWFYGKHAGDFVLTIGGYHPQFKVPAHYPTVPRVGFEWQVCSGLSLKGEMYCALTPSAMMAGGALQALYRFERTVSFDIGIAGAKLTGIINATFAMAFDLLLSWQPFYYKAALSVSIGIQVNFRGTARFLWYKKTVERSFNLHLGARLEIWGPEFSGIAHVNWSIISFDVAFGAKKKILPKKLSYEEFEKAFLPAPNAVCSLSLTDGLIRQTEASDKNNKKQTYYVVNPSELKISVSSVIPICNVMKPKGSDGSWARIDNSETKESITGKDFGIASMQQNNVRSTLKIEVTRGDKDVTSDFAFCPVEKSVPAAIWGGKLQPELNAKSLLDGMLMGCTISTDPKDCGEAQESTPEDGAHQDGTVKVWDDRTVFTPADLPENGIVSKKRKSIVTSLLGFDTEPITLNDINSYISIDAIRIVTTRT